MGEGSVVCTPRVGSTLFLADLWDEEEEEIVDLPMLGAMEPVLMEDPAVTIEDFFRDLHPEGQQASMASAATAQGEGVEPENTMVEPENVVYGGQEEEV